MPPTVAWTAWRMRVGAEVGGTIEAKFMGVGSQNRTISLSIKAKD